jgi:hypothetical protein
MTRLNLSPSRILGPLLAAIVVFVGGQRAAAQTATDITGLYFTGLAANGNLGAGGTTDAHWNVTYSSTDGGSTVSANEGAAYVISPSSVAGSGYTANTSSAQWITAPGAYVSASTASAQNAGGDFLPGNGNTGSNEGIFVYTLAFQIVGTGGAGTAVTSQIQITMTLSADDQYSIFVNPAGNGLTDPTGTASANAFSAWGNKSQIALQNYGSGGADNANFVVGTNYLVVVVDNTNSISGASGSNSLNASGLLVYQTGAAEINGKPIPEVAPWLPLLGVLGCYGFFVRRRQQAQLRPVVA